MNNKEKSINKLRFVWIIIPILSFVIGYLVSASISVKRSEYDSLLLYYEALSQKVAKLEEDSLVIKNSESSDKSSYKNDSKTGDSFDEDSSEFVFISKSGKKYHKENCSSLKDNSEKITLKQAQEIGKEPCKICHK